MHNSFKHLLTLFALFSCFNHVNAFPNQNQLGITEYTPQQSNNNKKWISENISSYLDQLFYLFKITTISGDALLFSQKISWNVTQTLTIKSIICTYNPEVFQLKKELGRRGPVYYWLKPGFLSFSLFPLNPIGSGFYVIGMESVLSNGVRQLYSIVMLSVQKIWKS